PCCCNQGRHGRVARATTGEIMDIRSYTRPVTQTLGRYAESLPEWEEVRERLPEMPEVSDAAVAKGLGWASIAIGLTEILMPRKLERTMGIGNGQNTGILRVLGMREILQGVDILSHRDPTPGIWARVFGDVLDGVLLTIVGTKTKKPGGFVAICA